MKYKEDMDRNEDSIQEENAPQPLDRRTLLTTAGLALLGILGKGEGLALNTMEESEEKISHIHFTPRFLDKVPVKQQEIIRRAGQDYVNMYKLMDQIVIDVQDNFPINENGEQDLIVSQSGKITLNERIFDAENLDSPHLPDLRSQILHHLTHAIVPKEENKLSLPVSWGLSDNTQVQSIHGFSLGLKTPQQTQEPFDLIEDGVAEILAIQVDKNYRSSSLGFVGVAILTNEVMRRFQLDSNMLLKMIKTNDLMEFVRILSNKKNFEVQDLEQVMIWYKEAAEGRDVDLILQEIPFPKNT